MTSVAVIIFIEPVCGPIGSGVQMAQNISATGSRWLPPPDQLRHGEWAHFDRKAAISVRCARDLHSTVALEWTGQACLNVQMETQDIAVRST